MLSAIAVEIWNIYTVCAHVEMPNKISSLFWLERLVVTAHLMEALVAAYFASKKDKSLVKYATYTFFVGTVGLLELFSSKS
ncbi:MAG: hypothetical protein HRU34_13830 [Richelia sp.]|nr:hypothetical protein [Richelia sp.]